MSKKEIFCLENALSAMQHQGFRPHDEFSRVSSFKDNSCKIWTTATVKIIKHEKGHIFDFLTVQMGIDEKACEKGLYSIIFLGEPTLKNLQEAYNLYDRDCYPTPKLAFLMNHVKVAQLKKHLDYISYLSVKDKPLPEGVEIIAHGVPKTESNNLGDPTFFIISINGTTYRIDGKFDSWDYGNPDMATYQNILDMKPVTLKEKVITVYE